MTKYIRIKSPLHKQSEINLHVLLNETCQNSQPYCIFIQNDNPYRTILIKNRCHFVNLLNLAQKQSSTLFHWNYLQFIGIPISCLVLWYKVAGLQRPDSKNNNKKLIHNKITVCHKEDCLACSIFKMSKFRPINISLWSSTCPLTGFFWLLNHVIYLKLTKVSYECLLSQS